MLGIGSCTEWWCKDLVLHREPLPFPLGNYRHRFVCGLRAALTGGPLEIRDLVSEGGEDLADGA